MDEGGQIQEVLRMMEKDLGLVWDVVMIRRLDSLCNVLKNPLDRVCDHPLLCLLAGW